MMYLCDKTILGQSMIKWSKRYSNTCSFYKILLKLSPWVDRDGMNLNKNTKNVTNVPWREKWVKEFELYEVIMSQILSRVDYDTSDSN